MRPRALDRPPVVRPAVVPAILSRTALGQIWFGWTLLGLGLALVLTMVVAVGIGAISVPAQTVAGLLVSRIPFLSIEPNWTQAEAAIVLQVRLPRVVAGMLAGAALATAGVLFQGLLRNPLADPYLIGTSAGAALGATLALMLPASLLLAGFALVPAFAFLGAIGATVLVYLIARVGMTTSITGLILAGFVTSSLLTAIMTLIVTLSDRLQLKIRQLFTWLMGGVSVYGWEQIALILPLIVLGIIAAGYFARSLNALSTGEEQAGYLGVEVDRVTRLVILLGALLTASAVSISGLIGFVGLVIPHAVRIVIGPDHRRLLPAAALCGAIFLTMADTFARTLLAPTEIPVGILTALVGAPVFLILLRRSRGGYQF